MKRFTPVVLVIAMACVALAATASSALALPTFLPGSGNLTIKSGEGKLVAGSNTVVCKSDTGSGKLTSETLGTFTVLFENCKSTGFIEGTCTGLSDTIAGHITVSGTFHLRYIKKTEPKSVGILFLIPEVHFSCEAFGIKLLALVRGTLVCPITPINKTVKTTEHYTVKCEKPNPTKVFNEAGTAEESAGLESSFNGGAFEKGEEVTTEEVSDSVESKIDA
jgi:hypothetical protein